MADVFSVLARLIRKSAPTLPEVRKEIVPAPAFLPPNYNRRALFSDWDPDRAITIGYKSCGPVYAAVRRLAEAASQVPWQAVTRGRSGLWTPRPGHPLELLLEHPNPYTSRYEWMERSVASLYLTGNALSQKILVSRTLEGASEPAVTEIWPLQTYGMSPTPDPKVFISEYVYNRGGGGGTGEKRFPAETIIHFAFMDPANPYWGLAPLQAASKDVDVAIQSVEWNMYGLQNRAVADGAFVSKEAMTEEQYREAKNQITAEHQGARNAHQPWVLGGGWSWEQMTITPVEMDFINSFKNTRDAIFSVFGVPPIVAGYFDDASLNNATMAQKMFWMEAVIPMLERIRICLERALVPHFGDPSKLGIRYDLSGVEALREDFEAKARAFYMFQKAGVPYNEAGRIVGLTLEDQGQIGDQPFGLVTGNGNKQQRAQQAGTTIGTPPQNPPQPSSPQQEATDRDGARGPLPTAAAAGSGSQRDATKATEAPEATN